MRIVLAAESRNPSLHILIESPTASLVGLTPPVPVPSSKEDIDVMANKVHSVPVITKSYEAAYPIRKLLRKKDNIWWNSELANL